MELLFQLGIISLLLLIGWSIGGATERRHFRSLVKREAQLRDILVFNERRPPQDQAFGQAALVMGSVVIGEDYFKRFAATLRSLFGGTLRMYESVMDRGRREAIVRMKAAARRQGATMVFNVRFETSSLSADAGQRSSVFSAEFIAYGTALKPR
ncbi:MAG: heavy metal-binding domain-containing protein [Pseudomonadales bacterium]|nr:heavy metal-binding domain-containing protein [Pseudomonadales bacterium]